MSDYDDESYVVFTGPARLDKAIHTLEGIVEGISIDGRVNDKELVALTNWIGDHSEFSHKHPFNEIIPRLNEILMDGVVDDEEKADILWLCDKLTTNDSFYSKTSADMQRLQGLLSGIISDGIVTEDELRGLQDWLESHKTLRTCWPYEEVDALVTSVLADGIIDEKEQRQLMRFFGEFSSRPGSRTVQPIDDDSLAVTGICAVCPEIIFESQNFCFTGKSRRYPRSRMIAEVESRGGVFIKGVRKDLNYLVVGNDGNECWAFACYGRKVELAVSYRKQGCPILIVHEDDFWDTIG